MRTESRGSTKLRRALLLQLSVLIGLLFAVVAHAENGPSSERFTVSPYLLDVTTDSATVAFHLPRAVPAEVNVDFGHETRRFASPEPHQSHFVRVTGLSPGRSYSYEVVAGAGAIQTARQDPTYQIRTACLAGESFTFVVYGDPRPGESQTTRHHQMLVEQMLQTEPAFSLVLGDLVDDGSVPAQWEEFFGVEAALRARSAIFPVPGDNDHMEGRGRAADYFPMAARGPYHFEWGGIHFFAMSTWGTLGPQPESEFDEQSAQVRWLDAELAREPVRRAPFRVVFLHDPITISRGRSSEVLRRAWAPLLSRGRVDLVFASWHLYERLQQSGVTYVISGGAGAEIIWQDANPAIPSQAEAKRHHFCRVDVEPGAMQLRAIAEDGTVLDSVTLGPRSDEPDRAATTLVRLSARLGREILLPPLQSEPGLTLELFAMDCGYCRRLLEHDLPRWSEEHGVALRVHLYDLSVPGAYDLLLAAGAAFGRQGAELPTVFVGHSVLGGEKEIGAGLPHELQRFHEDPRAYVSRALPAFAQPQSTSAIRERRFEALRFADVLAAGLRDGIAPCTFAAAMLLLYYLGLAGCSRQQLLQAAGLCTLGVFLANFAAGVLFQGLPSTVTGHPVAAMAVHGGLAATLLVLAVLGCADALRALQGRAPLVATLSALPTLSTPSTPSTAAALSTPSTLLQDRMRGWLRASVRRKMVIPAASVALGAVVTGLELRCIGELYVPVTAMIAEPRQRATATLFLLVYELAFVVPLVLFLLLAVRALTSRGRAGRETRQRVASGLGLGLLCAALAWLIVHSAGWSA